MKEVTLVGGEKILAHEKSQCANQKCCIHNPSNHHMRNWKQHWRNDTRKMERICEHGVGHPDPDDLNKDKIHGCDGCCKSRLAGDEVARHSFLKEKEK